jgi:hypothetical protein
MAPSSFGSAEENASKTTQHKTAYSISQADIATTTDRTIDYDDGIAIQYTQKWDEICSDPLLDGRHLATALIVRHTYYGRSWRHVECSS